MKFRVSAKDFGIFIVFCIFLLYLCAIAVLNFTSFANDGTFYGLNPFPAFGRDYLLLTLFLFGVALAIIFSSVSSYIFDRDKSAKNFLTFDEKDVKGYSRWTKEKEMKKEYGVVHIVSTDQTVEGAGIPLINDGKNLWVDNSYYHSLIIGSTGSGKSESIVKPLVNTLAKKGESMVINDPKGELYRYCGDYLKSQDYNIIVLNFREPSRGNSWNPLAIPYYYYKNGNKDKAIELIKDIGSNILVDPKNKDPFWEQTAADYFCALALGLFEDGKEDEININSIFLMDSVGDQRFGGSRYINEYFNMKGEDTAEYVFASATINAPGETKGGIQSTFRSKLQKFATQENLSEMLSYSDFDMETIGEKKTAIFLIIHDEKTTYHSLLTIFLKQCYEVLIDVAQKSGGKLKYRTNFILDEFQNMPPLTDVDSMVSAARSRNIRFTFIIQNFAALNDVYGKEVAETLKGNCGNLVYLISTEMAALEEISKMCGEVKSKEKDKTASTPLVTVSDLQKMKLGEVIIKRLRMNPFKTKLAPDEKMDWGIERRDFDYPVRETRELKMFDLKTFVSEEKRRKMESEGPDMMGGGFNPFMPPGGMGMNPFMGSLPTPTELPSLNKPISSLSNEEIDKMIADIDKKLKALDEEEKEENSKQAPTPEIVTDDKTIETPQDKKDEPIIHVDEDSIVSDTGISDDEFFDDFFNE